MKKLTTAIALLIAALAFATPVKNDSSYYEIATVDDLDWLSATLRSKTACGSHINAVLVADLDYRGNSWVPLCAGTGDQPFSGVFDGAGHTISNLVIDGEYLATVNKTYQQNLGFVGALSGKVNDLNLSNVSVYSVARGGTVAAGDPVKKAIGVGTLVGWMNATGEVNGSYVTGHMHTHGYAQAIGGIAGNCWGKIHNTISTVSIVADSLAYVGGIAGYTKSNAVIDHVVWNGQVIDNNTGGKNGGIVGYVYEGTLSVQSTMYNSAAVDGGIGKAYDTNAVTGETIGSVNLSSQETACTLNNGNWIDDSGCSVTGGKWYVGLDGLQVGGVHQDYGILTLIEKGTKQVGLLDGSYRPTVPTGIVAEPIQMDSLVFSRKFGNGQNSTICFPVSIPAEHVHGIGLYKLQDVTYNQETSRYTVTMIPETDGIVAGKPYVVVPTDTVMTITGGPYTIESAVPGTDVSTDGNWELTGVYSYTVGDALPNRASSYGFAARNVDGFTAGQFVKVGKKGYFYPFRVYLTYTGATPLRKTAVAQVSREIPDQIDVVFADAPESSSGSAYGPESSSSYQDTGSSSSAPREATTALYRRGDGIVARPDTARAFDLVGRRVDR